MMRRLACLRGLLPRSGSVSSAVLRVFLVSTFCSLALMAMTDFLGEQPQRPAGWLEPLTRLLNGALATFNGGPELSYDRSRSLQLYRLLITLCLVIASCFFIGSRKAQPQLRQAHYLISQTASSTPTRPSSTRAQSCSPTPSPQSACTTGLAS